MPFLETAAKMVRLLSAIVWLAVGLLTFWVTWRTFQELDPFLRTLRETPQQLGAPTPASRAPSGGFPIPDFGPLLRAPSGIRGSR